MTERSVEAQAEDAERVPVSTESPDAYLARDRRRALVLGKVIPDRVRGSALFADISGFTQLTEVLQRELGPKRGSEALTASLDLVFQEIIDCLHDYGGDVIYFSGDAITAWIDGDDGHRAVASGLAMQSTIARLGAMQAGGGILIEIGLKVSIATGEVRRAVVGDPSIQLIDVLAGSLLDALAETDHWAEDGDVLIDESTYRSLGDDVILSGTLVDPNQDRVYGVVRALVSEEQVTSETVVPKLDPDVSRQWLLPVVYERLSAGRGEFLAELRPAYPVFVYFAGLDFDRDDSAIVKLKNFVLQAQRVFDQFGGNVLQLTLGDKGANLYGVFGSPVAHEEDAARAVSAALGLVKLSDVTDVQELRVGIAHGHLRSGTYGHQQRRTFACLGDAANTAARLMAAAPPSTILATEDVRLATGESFNWSDRMRLNLKGKEDSVVAHELISLNTSSPRRRQRYELPMYGRNVELQTLQSILRDAQINQTQIIGIAAEAGLGKSRLVSEFVQHARLRGASVAYGECQAYGVNTSYFVWQSIWRQLLQIADDLDADQQRNAVERSLTRIDPSLVPRAPLLSNVIGISIPDNDLTRSFDAKLRKSSLEDLLVRCLLKRSGDEPLVIVLEDCHWIDSLSRELLVVLSKPKFGRPVLFLLAYRPVGGGSLELELEQFPQFRELRLQELETLHAKRLVEAKARSVFGVDDATPEFVELIVEHSQGNPFYAEELLNYVASRKVRTTDIAALKALDLPDSLQSLVLSRIDSLPEEPRRTLKVASVVGRSFRAEMLTGVYPALGGVEQIVSNLDYMKELDLVGREEGEMPAYLFRHIVTQEVSYSSMPFGIRADLHRRVGEFIEQTEAEDLDPHLDLLAHHFWYSDDEVKKRDYLARAESSASRRYANSAAIDYSERLVSLLDGGEKAEALLKLGEVLELTGAWGRAEEVANEAIAIAHDIRDALLEARCETALAETARKQGHYDEASSRLRSAARTFRLLGDRRGLGRVLHVSGTIAAQRGYYEDARSAYQESLEIRLELDDQSAVASLHSNLAIVAQYSGDYLNARRENEQALLIRRSIGDRWGISVSLNNLGMILNMEGNYAEACEPLEEAIALSMEVGDPWMVALANNTLANAFRELGDFEGARSRYTISLETYRNNEDLWALAFLFEDIAMLASKMDMPSTAFRLLCSADVFRDAIASPRNEEQAASMTPIIEEAQRALSRHEMDSLIEQSRRYSSVEAIEFGLGFTRPD